MLLEANKTKVERVQLEKKSLEKFVWWWWAGWYFPREPMNFVRRKFLKSQEILK